MFMFKSKKKKEDEDGGHEENPNSSPPLPPTLVDMPPQYAPLDTIPNAADGKGAEQAAKSNAHAEGATRKKGGAKQSSAPPAVPGGIPAPGATAAPLVPSATPATAATAAGAATHPHPKAKKKTVRHPSGDEAAKEHDTFSSPVPPSSTSTATPDEAAVTHAKAKKKHSGGTTEQTAHAVETLKKEDATHSSMLPPAPLSPSLGNPVAPAGIMTRKTGKSPQKTAKKNANSASGTFEPGKSTNTELNFLASQSSVPTPTATTTGGEGVRSVHAKGRRKGAGGGRVSMAKFVDVPDNRDAASVSTRAEATPVSLAQLRKAVSASNPWKHRDFDEESRVEIFSIDRDWGKSVASQSNAATDVDPIRSSASSVSGAPTYTEVESASTGKRKKKGAAGGVTALELQSALKQNEPRLQDQALASTRSSRTETYADAVRQREEALQLEREVNVMRMQAFFQHYAPNQMLNSDIASAVEEAQQTPGGLAEMWQLLVQYYGPEPVQRHHGMFQLLLENAYRPEEEMQHRDLRSPSPVNDDRSAATAANDIAESHAAEHHRQHQHQHQHHHHKPQADNHAKYEEMFAVESKQHRMKGTLKPESTTTTDVERVRLAFSGLRFATYARAETARQMAFHRAIEVQVSLNTGCHVEAVSVESIDPDFVVTLSLRSAAKGGVDGAARQNPSAPGKDSLARLQGSREPSSSNLAWAQLVELSRTPGNTDGAGARRPLDGRSASTTDPSTLAAVIHDCITDNQFSCNLIRSSYRDDLRGDVSYVAVASLINRVTLRHPIPSHQNSLRVEPRHNDASDQDSAPRSQTRTNTNASTTMYDHPASPILRVEQSTFSVGTENDSMRFSKSEERYVPSLSGSSQHHGRDTHSQSPPATPPPSAHWQEHSQLPSTARGHTEPSKVQQSESIPRFDKPSRNVGSVVQTARAPRGALGEDIVSSSSPLRNEERTRQNEPQYSEAPTFIQTRVVEKPRVAASRQFDLSAYSAERQQPQQLQRKPVPSASHVDAGHNSERTHSNNEYSVRRMNEDALRSTRNSNDRQGNTQPAPSHTSYVVSSPSPSVSSSVSRQHSSSYGPAWASPSSHASVTRASVPQPATSHHYEDRPAVSAPAPVPVQPQPTAIIPGSNRQSVPPPPHAAGPAPGSAPGPVPAGVIIPSRSPSGLIARHTSQLSSETAPPPPPPRQPTQTFASFAPSVASTRPPQNSTAQSDSIVQQSYNAPVPRYNTRTATQSSDRGAEDRSQARVASPWSHAISFTQK